MKHLLFPIALVLTLAPRSAAALPAPGSEAIPVIDAHTHPEFAGKPERRAEYMRQWKSAGLAGAVGILHTHDGTTPDDLPGRVVYCAGMMGAIDAARLEEGLRAGRYGCIKIYLGYEPYFASDPRYAPVYELAEKYDVAVVFHTGDTDRATAHLKYADPLTVDEIAVAHPKVRFVIAHCGNPWIESAAEVAYKNPNVWLDGSAFLVGDVSKHSREQVETYMIRPLRWIFGYIENPSKLMFASDWPVTNIPAYLAAFKRAIPRKHWRAVLHDNAAHVFRFDRPPPRATAPAGS
ncbi:MAG: amidohydrolase family protein [Acidobacteriota bacterium]